MFLGNLITQNQDPSGGIDAGVTGGNANSTFENTFGTVNPPQGVERYNLATGAEGGIGILIFFSRLIQLVFVVAGIWVIFNFISAGFTYLTAEGDSAATGKVKNKITMSVIGLVIIVSSYGVASILGLIIFGNANFILNPTIIGPTAP